MADQPICPENHDSGLAVASAVAGLLTLSFAVWATSLYRMNGILTADAEFRGAQTALAWFQRESEWLSEIIAAQPNYRNELTPTINQSQISRDSTVVNASQSGKEITLNEGAIAASRNKRKSTALEIKDSTQDDTERRRAHNKVIEKAVEEPVDTTVKKVVTSSQHSGRRDRRDSHHSGKSHHNGHGHHNSHRRNHILDDSLETAREKWDKVIHTTIRHNRAKRDITSRFRLLPKINRQKKMHLQLLDELKDVERELTKIVEAIEPPDYGLQWYGEREPKLAQPKNATEMVETPARSPRRQDTETGARGQPSGTEVKPIRKRVQEWWKEWTWHKITRLSLWWLPRNSIFRKKLQIYFDWMPRRDKALSLRKKRESMATRLLFAYLVIIETQLSSNEPRNTYHDRLIQNLENRRLGYRRENSRGQQTPVIADGQ